MKENRAALEEWQKPPVDGPGRVRILSDLEVRDILLDPRVMREIAREYDISLSLVARIKNRTASYFQTRNPRQRGEWEPNAELGTLPIVGAPVGHPTLLDEEDVQKILNDARSMKELAAAMGISISTVWRVRNREYQGRSRDFVRPPRIVARLDRKMVER